MAPLASLVHAWLLPASHLDLRARCFAGICLLSGLLSIAVVVPTNVLLGLPAVINVTTVVFGLVMLGMHVAARRGVYLVKTLLPVMLAALNVVWFPTGGSLGGIAFYLFPVLMYPIVFFDGRLRWLSLALVVVDFGVLLALDAQYPPVLALSHGERLANLFAAFVISSAYTVVVLWVATAGYDREHARLGATLDTVGESRALLETLIDSTDDMAWLVDAQTRGVKVYNRAFAAFYRDNYGVEVWAGMRSEDVLPPAVAARWQAFYARTLTEGNFSEEYTSHAGQRVWHLTFNRVTDKGRLFGLSVFAKDVTDRTRAEADRDRLGLQLLEAQKMESLGSLAGGVAHDFNNMLAGILGYAELLLEGERDPERRGHLRAIVQAATRSSDLTRKLLAFARRGKNIVEPVSIGHVVRESLTLLRPSFGPGVTVAPRLHDAWTVDADPSQMHQLVVNLVINANEATCGAGTIEVTTSNASLDPDAAARLQLEPGDYVVLEVADTGTGMSEEVRARIFEPFFTTKSGRGTGTGLGLSTVYGIVKLHRGEIAVDSTPGRGTTFTVYLPKGRLRSSDVLALPLAATGQGLVLVVEDEELLRRFTTAALQRLGYRVVTAEDGHEGVRVFERQHAELACVLLDLKMPGRAGREVFAEMRRIAPRVPVLICSGYGDNEEVQGLITLGARGLLPKPFTLAELAEKLASLRA